MIEQKNSYFSLKSLSLIIFHIEISKRFIKTRIKILFEEIQEWNFARLLEK